VTYSKDGRDVGDTALFAGGYIRVDENKVHNYPPHPTLYHQFNKVWIES